jgi:tetratricopeptide (TPR) repeat protein
LKLFIPALAIALLATAPSWQTPALAAPAQPCGTGEALYKSGRYEAAETFYAKALEKLATRRCAEAGLEALDENEKECVLPTALEGAGLEAKAETAFEEALKKHPNSKCAKDGLMEEEEGLLDDPEGKSKTLISWLGVFAVLVGCLVLAIAVLLLGMTRVWGLRNLWPASRVRAVRVGIDSFEDNITPSRGGPIAALVRSKIESFGAKRRGMTMVDSQAASEETIWTKFGAINDQAKAVSAVILAVSALYPRRQFQATGVVQADTGAGPGLSLALRKRQELAGTTTLWAEDFGLTAEEAEPPGEGEEKAGGDEKEGEGEEKKTGGDQKELQRLQNLAVPAAAWISHVTTTAAGKDPGGAKDPRSWALFKAGSEWERNGDAEKAKSLYETAIALDSTNWGALAQLGALENEDEKYAEAIEHLTRALEVLES